MSQPTKLIILITSLAIPFAGKGYAILSDTERGEIKQKLALLQNNLEPKTYDNAKKREQTVSSILERVKNENDKTSINIKARALVLNLRILSEIDSCLVKAKEFDLFDRVNRASESNAIANKRLDLIMHCFKLPMLKLMEDNQKELLSAVELLFSGITKPKFFNRNLALKLLKKQHETIKNLKRKSKRDSKKIKSILLGKVDQQGINVSKVDQLIDKEISQAIENIKNAKKHLDKLNPRTATYSYLNRLVSSGYYFSEATRLAKSSIKFFKEKILYNDSNKKELKKALKQHDDIFFSITGYIKPIDKKPNSKAVSLFDGFTSHSEDGTSTENSDDCSSPFKSFMQTLLKLQHSIFMLDKKYFVDLDKDSLGHLNDILTEWTNILEKVKTCKSIKKIPEITYGHIYNIENCNDEIEKKKQNIRKEQIRKLKNIITGIKRNLPNTSQNVKKSKLEKKSLQDNLNNIKIKSNNLCKQIEDLNLKLEKSNSERKELKTQLDDAHTGQQSLQAQVKNLQEQANKLKSQNAKLNNEQNSLLGEKDKVNKEWQKQKALAEKLRKNLFANQKKLTSFKASMEVFQETVATLQSKLSSKQDLKTEIMKIAKDKSNTLQSFVENNKTFTDLLKKQYPSLGKYSTKDIILSMVTSFQPEEQTTQE